jgi:hypothetical protein
LADEMKDKKNVSLIFISGMVNIHPRASFILARGIIQLILFLFLVQFIDRYLALADASEQPGWNIDSLQKGQVEYTNPAYGMVFFTVPLSWRSTVNPTDKQKNEVIAFGPQSGRAFKMLLEPLLFEREIIDFNDKDIVRMQVEQLSNQFNKSAVENPAVLQELRNRHSIGYYFTIESPIKAKLFDWQCLTQGRILVGAIYMQFSILSQSVDAKEISQGLEMLATAKYQILK